jgi:hypothetical protein
MDEMDTTLRNYRTPITKSSFPAFASLFARLVIQFQPRRDKNEITPEDDFFHPVPLTFSRLTQCLNETSAAGNANW